VRSTASIRRWRRLHTWSSLACTAVLLSACLTGLPLIFADEIAARNEAARRYADGLKDVVTVPLVPEGYTSVWAQYTIRLKPGAREGFAAKLKAQGVPTAVYYPKPLHRLDAYRRYPVVDNGIPVTDRLAEEVISLPMHAYLDAPTQERVIAAVRSALG